MYQVQPQFDSKQEAAIYNTELNHILMYTAGDSTEQPY